MATWHEIFNKIDTGNALEELKKQFFNDLHKETNRNVVVYFSAWQQKTGVNGAFSITDNDRNGFMNVLHGLDKSLGLDLILHTPGGDLTATKSIVEYLYSYFDGNIRVIIPHTAMSAGTMIACSGKEILMGLHSNLGPIDPQINNVPANEYLETFQEALKQVSENKNKEYWQNVLKNYPPTFFGLCKKAIDLSEKYVSDWLSRCMLKDSQDDVALTVKYLADYKTHLQHSTRLHIDDLLTNTKLKITRLEDNHKLQDLVLSLYHCYQILAERTSITKIIENHNNLKYINNLPNHR